jgi:hypothetical protein
MSSLLLAILVLSLMAPAAIRADVSVGGTSKSLSLEASKKFPAEKPSPPLSKPRKLHRQPNRRTRDSAAIQKSVAQAGGSDSRAGVSDIKKTTPGNIDVLKGNDAGQSNQQSPDHVPGTTGTSGQ